MILSYYKGFQIRCKRKITVFSKTMKATSDQRPKHYTVSAIKRLLSKGYEVCGPIEIKKKKALFRLTHKGSKTVRECPVPNFPRIWHTHPFTSKAYPSRADLRKVLKHNVSLSIIFTIYGYWVISCPVKYDEQIYLAAHADFEKVNKWFYDRVYNNSFERDSEVVKRRFGLAVAEYSSMLNSILHPLRGSILFLFYQGTSDHVTIDRVIHGLRML